MGTNNLTDIQPGGDPQPSDLNQYKTALSGDVVPRNAAGHPQAGGADVGQQALPWRNGYFEGLFINGQPVGTGSGSGGGTTSGIALRNGVIAGRSPNNRDGYPGWMVQAGSAGVTLLADADNPLEVKLDGVSYQLVADTTGGLPLPTALNVSCQFIPRGRGEMYPCGGGQFNYGSNNIPATEGDIFCFRFDLAGGGREYLIAFRGADDMTAMLGTRGIVNTSPNDLTVAFGGDMSEPQPATAIRVGHVFVDPTTATWTLGIERRIIGAVASELPTENLAVGEMIYREFDQRWYRYSGSAWIQTSRVYLGMAIIDGGAVVGVVPVRGETALRSLIMEWNNAGAPLAELAIDDHAHFFANNAHRDIEQKTNSALLAQSLEAYNPDYTIEKPDTDGIYAAYIDLNTHTAFAEPELAPQWIDTGENGGRCVLIHPHRHAIYIGSFSVSEGTLYAGRIDVDGAPTVTQGTATGLIDSSTEDVLYPWIFRAGRQIQINRVGGYQGQGGINTIISADRLEHLSCVGTSEQWPDGFPHFELTLDAEIISAIIIGEVMGTSAYCRSGTGTPSFQFSGPSGNIIATRQEMDAYDTFLQTQNLR